MVFEQVLILVVFVAIGYILSKLKVINSENSQILSSILVYVFLPCNVFKTYASNFNREYIVNHYKVGLVSLLLIAVIAVLAFFIAKLFTKNSYDRKVYEYSMVVPNSGYMGYPLAESLLEGAGLINFMVFSIPVQLYIYTYGFSSLTKCKLSLKKLLNPLMITILLGMIFGLLEIPIPDTVTGILEKSGSCMGPVSMLLAGVVISQFKLKDVFGNYKIYILSAISLIILPLALGGILRLFCDDSLVAVAVLFYSLPCGLNSVVFPKLVGEDCRTGAGIALISTLISVLSIPLMFAIFGIGA